MTTIKLTTITLDGRTFDATAQLRTHEQREYLEYQLWRAGVIEIPNDLGHVTRAKERSAEDAVTAILFSGRKSYVLAGCLTEQGRLWNRYDADANATRFEQITDATEKAAMQSFLAEFAADFFSEGK